MEVSQKLSRRRYKLRLKTKKEREERERNFVIFCSKKEFDIVILVFVESGVVVIGLFERDRENLLSNR